MIGKGWESTYQIDTNYWQSVPAPNSLCGHVHSGSIYLKSRGLTSSSLSFHVRCTTRRGAARVLSSSSSTSALSNGWYGTEVFKELASAALLGTNRKKVIGVMKGRTCIHLDELIEG